MNHFDNEENNNNNNNKAPITRVFNLNGLRRNSQHIKNENENNLTIRKSSSVKFEVTPGVPFEKKVYNVGEFNFHSLKLNNNAANNYKSQNENVKLVTPTTPIKPISLAISEKINSIESNAIISQHVSEIDIDEKYESKKVNPVYKSDSEGDDDNDDNGNKKQNIEIKSNFNIDFDDYSGIYQDPVEIHQAINNLNFKKSIDNEINMSIVNVTNENENDYDNNFNSIASGVVTDDEIYATINENDLYLTPIELKLDIDQQKISVKEKYIKELKGDMVKEYVAIKVSSSVLKENIAVVFMYNRIWVAGLSSANVSKSLFRHLYIGDIILAINNQSVNSIIELNVLIEKYKNTTLHLRLKRLQFARAVFIPISIPNPNTLPSFDGKYIKHVKSILGLKLDTNKPRIEKIDDSGAVYKNGLRFNPNRFLYDLSIKENLKIDDDLKDDKNRLTTWTFTEINGNPIDLFSNCDKVAEQLFTTKDNEICFIVQPSDLIKTLLKELKKTYQNWKKYLIV